MVKFIWDRTCDNVQWDYEIDGALNGPIMVWGCWTLTCRYHAQAMITFTTIFMCYIKHILDAVWNSINKILNIIYFNWKVQSSLHN